MLTNLGPSSLEEKRRDRVAKACALCRRKKIKCDGMMPCNHCQHLSSSCFYELNKQRKPRAKATDNLLHRIGKLEDLVIRIAEKVDSIAEGPNGTASVRPDLPALQPSDSDQESSPDDRADGNLEMEVSSELLRTPASEPLTKDKDSYFQQCKAIMTEAFEKVMPVHTRKVLPHYKGSHLGISMVFSPQSMSFIQLKLRPQDQYITTPMESMLFYITAWKRVFQSAWTEPQVHTAEQIKKLKTGIFPHNRAIVDDMIRLYEVIHLELMCPASMARELFDAYYTNKTLPPEQRRKFLYSELLIMNLIIAFTTAMFIDNKNPVGEKLRYPSMDKIPISQLSSLQEELFINSIFYYNRIAAVSEGITSVQALLLMVCYLETAWVISDINFTLISTAVRYAQEMGLHRIETSSNLPDAERYQRIKLWAACQHMDIEMCYRLGKPPLVNIVDVSVLDLFNDVSVSDLGQLLCHGAMEGKEKVTMVQHSIHKSMFRLSQIRSLSYVKLFSASAGYQSVKQIQEIVTCINTNLFDMAREVPDDSRPRFYYEEDFDKTLKSIRIDKGFDHLCNMRCNLLLTYFSHLMTINRVPWQVVADDDDKLQLENSEYRRLSLESARTILHIVRNISREDIPHLQINWLATFPFAAGINIISNCLNHVTDNEIFKDLSLIIDISMNFFVFFGQKADNEHTRLLYMRLQIFDIIIRILLRITIKIIEEGSNMNILGSNPALKEHLEIIERKYPQFYRKADDPVAVSDLMKSLCPTFHPKLFRDSRNEMLNNSPSNISSNSLSSYVSTPRRTDPALPNIMHPTDTNWEMDEKLNSDWQSLGGDFLAFASEEMLNMPNFFFDNGL